MYKHANIINYCKTQSRNMATAYTENSQAHCLAIFVVAPSRIELLSKV